MLPKEADQEIEKLRLRKLEFTNKMNITSNFEEREDLEEEIERIDKQIQILEKLKEK